MAHEVTTYSEGPFLSPSVLPPERSPPSPSTSLHLARAADSPKNNRALCPRQQQQIEHVFVYDGIVI